MVVTLELFLIKIVDFFVIVLVFIIIVVLKTFESVVIMLVEY